MQHPTVAPALAAMLVAGAAMAADPAPASRPVSAPATAPATAPAPGEIARLVEQLGSERLALREAATNRLVEIGQPAESALRRATTHKDPEVRIRVEAILEEIDPREVHVVGLYEGCGAVHGGGQNRQPGTAEVHVRKKAKLLTIVLCSYEPVKWTLKVDDGCTVERVVLSGYYAQKLEGEAPRGAKLTALSLLAGDRDAFYAYSRDEESYAKMVAAVRARTGPKIKTFQGIYRPEATQVFRIGPD